MRCWRYLAVIFFVFCWVFPAKAMFPQAYRGKPGGEGKHIKSFHWPPPEHQTAFKKPRQRIFLAEMYFHKPPLKGLQKKALRKFEQLIPEFKVYLDQKTGLPIFIKGNPLYRRGTESFALSGRNKHKTALAALSAFKDALRIRDPSKEFVLRKETVDVSGKAHLRFEQRWQGIRYFGKELIVHLDEKGDVYLINGRYAETPQNIDTDPLLSAVKAASLAAEDLGSDPQQDVFHTELVIKEDNAGIPHLAWLIELRHGIETWRYFVDAKCAQILEKYRLAYDMAVSGSGQDEQTGQTHYFSVWQEGGQYYFIDTSLTLHTRDPSITAQDFGEGNIVILYLPYGMAPPQGPISWLFSNNPHNWPPAAVSVWYGLKETLEYYLRVHGRRGMDGNGSSAVGVINLTEANAFYDGGQQDFMYFGTGDGYQMGPLTALDVVAHEFTHGITNYTARLVYQFQPGALNEAFSDIFAAMIDREDWFIGEDVVLVPPYNLRDLSNPHNSLFPQPAHMSEYRDLPFDEDNGGVHINATIPAHAAYLLSQRIGREKAEKIFYKVLAEYLTPESEFRDFCLAMAQTAEEIFGANSSERQAVVFACNEVGIIQGEIPGGGGGGEEEPPEVPPIATQDYLLFIFLDFDPWAEEFVYYLAERTPDGNVYFLTERPVHPTRPAPFYLEGSQYVLFIDSQYNLWSANIVSEYYEEHLINDSGEIWSVATSPGTRKVVYTSTRDENIIYVWDPDTNQISSYQIKFQPPDASSPVTTYFPDVISLSLDGYTLFFDCYNRIRFGNIEYEFWALGKLDLINGAAIMLFPIPMEGFHIGNPATAHTKPYLLAFDIWTENWVETRILNLLTGRSGLVWQGDREEGRGTSGWPSFTGDDHYVVLQDLQPEGTEKLIAVPIQKVGETWEGNQTGAFLIPVEDPTNYGLIIPMVYRPGTRNVKGKAEIIPQTLDFGEVNVGSAKSLSVTIRNTGNYPLEFRGSKIEGGNEVFQTRAVHTSINPGEEYHLEVTFLPREEKEYSAVLKLYLSDPDLPEAVVNLYGKGKAEGQFSLDLKVNGSDGPLTLYREDVIVIRVSLVPRQLNEQGDYFLWAQVPGRACYCFVYPDRWDPCSCSAPKPSYQGRLVPLQAFRVYHTPCVNLPGGSYRLFFAVDTSLDGSLDSNAVKDEVQFEIF